MSVSEQPVLPAHSARSAGVDEVLQTATKPQLETAPQPITGELSLPVVPLESGMESENRSVAVHVNNFGASASSQERQRAETEYIEFGTLFWSAAARIGSEITFLLRFAIVGVIVAAVSLILVPDWYRAS